MIVRRDGGYRGSGAVRRRRRCQRTRPASRAETIATPSAAGRDRRAHGPRCRPARDASLASRCSPTSSRRTGSRRRTGSAGCSRCCTARATIPHAEITPPLSFLASWLTTRLGRLPELLRLPSLIAGTATIPLVYRARAGGPSGAGPRSLAAALTTLSPFMIYYSAEARAYGLMMLLVRRRGAVDAAGARHGRGRRWWVLYAVSSAAALLHALHVRCSCSASRFVWVAVGRARRSARRRCWPNAGRGCLLVVPWIPGTDQRLQVADAQDPLRAVAVHALRRSGSTSSTGRWDIRTANIAPALSSRARALR